MVPKRRILVVVLIIAVLICGGAAAYAGGESAVQDAATLFNDSFDAFESSRWIKSGHTLERSTLMPDNIVADNGCLRMKLPAGELTGAEIESADYYGYGSYTARMKLPSAPSSITGFFLYRSPDLHHEIDIEIYNDSSRKIDFTTYAGGEKTHTVTKTLDFDATQDFHDYRIVYKPDRVEFYVDDQLLQTWSDGVTDKPMKLLLNVWYPNWLEGVPADTDEYLEVDSIKAEA
ncbi:MAG: glycoside hydrolase family 16 protein [Peptococcaceae bacterium]|nr:glycoside hydrolase family 16 protein [Peptococcaceae bacterium]